jgi:hypothetical protein
MPIFNKPSADLVYDLINQANPQLVKPATTVNTKLGVPAVIATPGLNKLNTSIVLAAVPGGDYIGRKTVNYRRIDLAALTRGVTIAIDRYSATQASAGTVVFTIYQLLPFINQRYGLNLTTDDINDGNILRGSTLVNGQYTTTVTVTAKPGSLGYIGSFALKWTGAAQDIGLMLAVSELPARQFPGGNDFSNGHTVLNALTYGYDWTTIFTANPWYQYPAGNPNANIAVNTTMGAVFQYINSTYGTNFAPSFRFDNEYNFEVLTLPSAKYPELNSDYYNRCLVFTPTSDTAKAQLGAGVMQMHYNV